MMVKKKKKSIKKIKPRNPYLTGEDIDMLNERKEKEKKNICDSHEDGA